MDPPGCFPSDGVWLQSPLAVLDRRLMLFDLGRLAARDRSSQRSEAGVMGWDGIGWAGSLCMDVQCVASRLERAVYTCLELFAGVSLCK